MKRYLYGATILTMASSLGGFAALADTNSGNKASSEPNVKVTGENYKAPKVDLDKNAQGSSGQQQTDKSASSQQAMGASGQQASKGMSGQQAGKNPSDITCRELTTLDTRAVPGVIYYISGYSAGQNDGDASSSAGSSSGKAASGASASASGSNDSSKSGSASKSAGASASASDSSKSSSASKSGGTSGSSAGQSSAASSSKSATPTVVAMRGYYEIPVQEVLVTCRETPDSRASDVIEKQGAQSAG